MAFEGFDPSLLRFMRALERNNNRDWFKKNKQRYEDEVVAPVMEFIEAMAPRLERISPHFLALTGRQGGSMMRIYRDTRFSKDKTPYKTNVGVQFRHELGKDVHAPGYYIHFEPTGCFLGTGIWHPASDALGAIRQHIVDHPAEWKKVRRAKKWNEQFELSGDSLKRAPKGIDREHPLIEDLRRKDYMGIMNLDAGAIEEKDFVTKTAAAFRSANPLMRFLCAALDVPF